MELVSLENFIVVSPLSGHEKTESGLFVPVNIKRLSTEHGVVKTKGAACKSKLEVGDEIIYDKRFATEIRSGIKEDDQLFIIKEPDIYAYIKREDNEKIIHLGKPGE